MNYCCKCGKSEKKCQCTKEILEPKIDKMIKKPKKRRNVETK